MHCFNKNLTAMLHEMVERKPRLSGDALNLAAPDVSRSITNYTFKQVQSEISEKDGIISRIESSISDFFTKSSETSRGAERLKDAPTSVERALQEKSGHTLPQRLISPGSEGSRNSKSQEDAPASYDNANAYDLESPSTLQGLDLTREMDTLLIRTIFPLEDLEASVQSE